MSENKLESWTDENLHSIMDSHAAELKLLEMDESACIEESREFEFAAKEFLSGLQEEFDVVGVEVEIYDSVKGFKGIVDILAKHKTSKQFFPIELKTGKWKSFDHQVQVQLYLMILADSLDHGSTECSSFGNLVYLKHTESIQVPSLVIEGRDNALFSSILELRNQLACFIANRDFLLDQVEKCGGGRFGCLCTDQQSSKEDQIMNALVQEERIGNSCSEEGILWVSSQTQFSNLERSGALAQFQTLIEDQTSNVRLDVGSRVMVRPVLSNTQIQGTIQSVVRNYPLLTIECSLKPTVHNIYIGETYKIEALQTYNNMKFAKRQALDPLRIDLQSIYIIQG